jgi:two-component system heavy metal sensor histidine kinase CusS
MFLVTALIVSAVLVSVAVVAGSTFYAYELRRLDSRLCAEAWRLVSRPPQPGEQERFATDVAGKLRVRAADQLLLAREDNGSGGALNYGQWPERTALDQLDWSDVQASGPSRTCSIATLDAAGTEWRVARIANATSRGLVGADLSSIRAELWDALKRIAATAAPIALLLTGLGAWLLSWLALRPVNRFREAMKSVNERALDQRLSTEREAREFRELIVSYNGMLERLEAAFNQASRFSADAAHELKTPLTILRGQIERAIPLAESSGLQVSLAEMLDEVGRLASISRKLLLLSQADAGRLALLRTRVDLSAMLNERVADTQMLGLNVAIDADIEDGLFLDVDEQLVGQVLNNVLGNAIRYTPPGGRISVKARAIPQGVEVLFRNSVHHLSQIERARFFERFYRGDAARSREADGHGLGLSLSRVIARAHGGDLVLLPSTETEVALRLTLPQHDTPTP